VRIGRGAVRIGSGQDLAATRSAPRASDRRWRLARGIGLVGAGLLILAALVDIGLYTAMVHGPSSGTAYSWTGSHPLYIRSIHDGTDCAIDTGHGSPRVVHVEADGYLGLGNVLLPRGRWVTPRFSGPAVVTCGSVVTVRQPHPAAVYAVVTSGVTRDLDELMIVVPLGLGLMLFDERIGRHWLRRLFLIGLSGSSLRRATSRRSGRVPGRPR